MISSEPALCYEPGMRFARAANDIGIENVLGISWWCLGDNMELERGMTQPFGLFALYNTGLAPEYKTGVDASIRVAYAWRNRPTDNEEVI